MITETLGLEGESVIRCDCIRP